jgi:hypothetical protein
MPRLAQGIARFLYVESCNQCSACKHGLKMASESLNELFDVASASEDDLARALYGARSAPQGNRCYLPVQASVLISSIMESFKAEFHEQVAQPARPTEPILITKLTDYDPDTGTFTQDFKQVRKAPDWTYSEVEELTARPARESDLRRAETTVRLHSDIAGALQLQAVRSGKTVEVVVDEIVREFLARSK